MLVNANIQLTPAFYTKLLQVASDVQMKPEDILNIMTSESGIDPSRPAPDGDGSGLLQFQHDTLRGLGFTGTQAEFRQLSAEDQLDYVRKLIAMRTRVNGKPFTSAAHYYVANWLPAALKIPGIQSEDPNTVIVAKHPDYPHIPGHSIQEEAKWYKDNPSLDFDHDGAITYGDIQKVTQATTKNPIFQSAVAQMKNVTGYSPSNINTPPTNQTNINIDDLFAKYLAALSSNQSHYIKKESMKQLLPHDYLIKIQAEDTTNAIELARILCNAIDEELYSDAYIHSNGNSVEIQTTITGSKSLCTEALVQLSDAIATVFEKIAPVSVVICPNQQSNYHELGILEAMKHYDAFHNRIKNGQ